MKLLVAGSAQPILVFAALALLALVAVIVEGRTFEPVRYTLRFPAPSTHYVEIEATVPTGGRAAVEMMMAVWTPGSYLVREYSRHVEGFTARTPEGRPLQARKSRKNRWAIATGGVPTIVVTYRVYGRELSVRTNWIEEDFAILNGAPTFVTPVEQTARPHEVTIIMPRAWAISATSLARAGGDGVHRYTAPDFDTLVDSPLVLGNPTVHPFTVDGKRHELVNLGETRVWDGPRSAADVRRIVDAAQRLWGQLPYERYVFLNAIVEGSGGLEHKSSTLMMTSRWRTRNRRDYLAWLSLVSHEHFHAWLGKRLRPIELGPFDYENEVYTTALWVTEGFTDYYADLMLRRAGISTREEYLAELSQQIAQLETTPGRLEQPAALSSYDAWIKQYRPDENSPNSSISYYVKGAVAGFLLDARIRQATAGAKSLDDLLRLAHTRYSGATGFTEQQFRATAGEVAGTDLGPWFARVVDTTAELDFGEALDWFGLRFRPVSAESSDKGWLGAETKTDAGRLIVTRVTRGTPAYDSGVNVDDEILAIDEYRVRPEQLDDRLRQYRPGDRIELLVARRDALKRITVTLSTEPPKRWQLEIRPDVTSEQLTRLRDWFWER